MAAHTGVPEMNLIALTLLGMAIGAGEPGSDYYPIKSRTLKLDIDYKPEQRQNIQQVQLCISRDQGQTWEVADAVTPDKDHFVFNAKDDGLYWLNMVIVFRDGKKDPPDVTRVPPAQKLLVDATPPVVRITSAQRVGDEVVVDWAIEDKFPNDATTQVQFKPTGANAVGDWQPISAANIGKRSARFKPGSASPILVQVTTADMAGNSGTASKEVGGGTTTAYASGTSPILPTKPAGLEIPVSSDLVAPSPPVGGIVIPGAVSPPAPVVGELPMAPVAPQVIPPVASAQPPINPSPTPAGPTPWTPRSPRRP